MSELWIAVDKSGSICLFNSEPMRHYSMYVDGGDCIQISKEVMIKLIGREITWEDDPVKIE